MELGQRLRKARLEAGLSQRQLCGDTITRNMLSQIENGSARPSMVTLEYLAKQLGKPISYFLEEQAVTSPNQAVMDAARRAWQQSCFSAVLDHLEDYREPDPLFDEEMNLLLALANLRMGSHAAEQGRLPYAQALLDRASAAAAKTSYCGPELERAMAVLAAKLRPELATVLPNDDDVLLLRAAWALESGEFDRSAVYLDAAEDHSTPQWNLYRGKTHLAQKQYAAAAACLHGAEALYPVQTAPLLETCYREMEDFKRAYEYACKQR